MRASDDPMAELRATFHGECEDLIEAAQSGLLAMQEGSADAETLDEVFRAVHSIKGGAGAFALEEVVAFAHQFETVLDSVRRGALRPDPDIVLLLLRACDVRLPARLKGPELDYIAEALLAAAEEVMGEEARAYGT